MRRRLSNDTRDLIVLAWAGYLSFVIWSTVERVWK